MKNADIAEKKYAAGLIAEVELLTMRLDFKKAQDDFETQKLSYMKQLEDFKRFIGLPLTENIDIVSDLGENSTKYIEIDEQKAMQLAFDNNLTLRRSENNLKDQKNTIALNIAQDRIKASLNASYGLNEKDDMGKVWKNEWNWMKNIGDEYSVTNSVSIDLTLPLFDNGTRKRNIQLNKLQLEIADKNLEDSRENFRKDVQSRLEEIKNAWKRIKNMEGDVEIAEKTNEINQSKFALGELDAEQLKLSTDRVLRTKESVLNAQLDYILRVANLYVLTCWDFEHNCPLNETARSYIKGNQ